MSERPIDRKWTVGAFLAGQLTLLFSILLSIFAYGDFDFSDDSLSDLGVGVTAPIFNGGLMAGGILSGCFCGSLWTARWKKMGLSGKTGAVLQGVSFVFLANVGVFNQTVGAFHLMVATGFFVFLLCGTLLLGISLLQRGKSAFAFPLCAGIIGIVTWILSPFITGKGLAVPEMASALPCFLWLVLRGTQRYIWFEPEKPRRIADPEE